MPAPGADAVESVQEEVDRVVDLVIEHALTSPERSLAVIALNARHADRVREAVISAVSGSPAVADVFAADREEPFVVVDADGAAGLRRDTVVLTLGYAKTPHGRVLHSFGAISGPDGKACLIDALDAVRERLVLVSCIGPGEIDRDRLHQPGPRLLADLIDWAARPSPPGDSAATGAAPDPLLAGRAERLRRHRPTVVPQYWVDGRVRLPLAIGPPARPRAGGATWPSRPPCSPTRSARRRRSSTSCSTSSTPGAGRPTRSSCPRLRTTTPRHRPRRPTTTPPRGRAARRRAARSRPASVGRARRSAPACPSRPTPTTSSTTSPPGSTPTASPGTTTP